MPTSDTDLQDVYKYKHSLTQDFLGIISSGNPNSTAYY